ncbi:MAG: hypothetical protein R2824_24110 [Saprospiraceae bacterium]|nr:hypothetical protein [Lewinella sp.]
MSNYNDDSVWAGWWVIGGLILIKVVTFIWSLLVALWNFLGKVWLFLVEVITYLIYGSVIILGLAAAWAVLSLILMASQAAYAKVAEWRKKQAYKKSLAGQIEAQKEQAEATRFRIQRMIDLINQNLQKKLDYIVYAESQLSSKSFHQHENEFFKRIISENLSVVEHWREQRSALQHKKNYLDKTINGWDFRLKTAKHEKEMEAFKDELEELLLDVDYLIRKAEEDSWTIDIDLWEATANPYGVSSMNESESLELPVLEEKQKEILFHHN